jgi:Rrf2 family protein
MPKFLKVSTKLHAALMLMSILAKRYKSRRPLTLTEFSKSGFSHGYLEQVATSLRRAKLISGQKGAGGGYVLVKNPETIKIKNIIEAIEGPISLVDCLGNHTCGLGNRCASKSVWTELQNKIIKTLNNLTLKDLI